MCYFLDHMINIKNLILITSTVDGKSNKNILIYYIGYPTLNSVKPFYFNISKIIGHIEEHIGNKYLTLFQTYESQDSLKECE